MQSDIVGNKVLEQLLAYSHSSIVLLEKTIAWTALSQAANPKSGPLSQAQDEIWFPTLRLGHRIFHVRLCQKWPHNTGRLQHVCLSVSIKDSALLCLAYTKLLLDACSTAERRLQKTRHLLWVLPALTSMYEVLLRHHRPSMASALSVSRSRINTRQSQPTQL